MDENKPSTDNDPNSATTVTDLINITIKTIDSKNYKFQVENNIKIRDFKEMIGSTVDIEPDQQRMIYCGRVLSDEKTLLDYKIDNNKVIHLVKRQIRTAENTSQNTSQNTNSRTSSRSRIRSFRNEDGTLFMGSFSMDPPTLINQVMRQIFPTHRQNVSSQSESGNSDANAVRNRLNQIRQLLSYVEANFQLLENPNQLPRAIMGTELFDENHQFSPADYIKCFTDVLNFIDRARPLLQNWFQSFRDNSTNEPSNISTIIRIVHHISHILHALTDLRIDRNNDSPISVNVLLDPINIPNILNNARSNNSTTTNTSTNTNNNTEEESGTNAESNVESAPNNETQDPPLPSIPTANASYRFNSLGRGNVFMAQSPILLMEVDATINGHRTSIGSRSIPNFSISDLNVTINNLLNNAHNVNFIPMNSTNGSNTNNDNATDNSTSVNEQNMEQNNDSSATQSQPQTQTNNEQQNSTNDSNVPPPPPPLAIVFDPYLSCNSTFTVPELRSTINGPEDFSFTNMPVNQFLTNLTDILRFETNTGNNDAEQNTQTTEFFDFIHYLFDRLNPNMDTSEMGNFPGTENGELRINDYFRLLELFESQDDSLLLNMLQFLAENFNFEQLYNLIQFNYHDFDRLRQPTRAFIRANLLHGQEPTSENIENKISSIVDENIAGIVANIKTVPGIDIGQSFSNFVKKALVNFFTAILQSSDNDNFETTITNAFKRLVLSYAQFCRSSFDNPEHAINTVIKNFLTNYIEFVNARLITFLTTIITDRINMCLANSEIDNSLKDEINSCLVWENNNMETSTSVPNVPSAPVEGDAPSNSYDSEDIEFSDAISDVPSTSNVQNVGPNGSEQCVEWQSVVPNDWVPIINEDINKQKNMSQNRQPPFSDAYLRGMSKKRRLENDPNKK